MSELLTEKEVSVYVNDLNDKQEAMIKAIKDWQQSKQNAEENGLELSCCDNANNYVIYSIISVKYSPTLFYKL